jgi:hypothetical protein
MINDYIKKTEIKIQTIKKRIKAQRKIMLRDLKGQKYVLGLFKGKNYFDRLKKDLESNMKALDRVLKKRLLFIEDIEEAKNAIATFNSISKTQKDELFKERADALKNYEKYKSYFDKITRYNEEYMEPLIEMQNQKADLFAKIQYYKNQFFNFNVDTLNEDFSKWKIQTMSAYANLKEVTKKSDKFGNELKAGVDDITFMINMLNTQLTKQPVKELVNDWKTIKKNLELCETLQNGVSKTGAAVLNKLANMEPVANVMGDLFNMKTAQAIVDDKINFIHTELESKYQNSDNSYDYVKKLVVKFMKGGATDINSLDGFTPDLLTGIASSFTSLLRRTRRLNAQAGGRRNMMTGKLLTHKTGGAGPDDPYNSLFNFPLNFVTTFDATNDRDTIRSTYKLKIAGKPDISKYIVNVNNKSDFKPENINTTDGDCVDEIYFPNKDLLIHLHKDMTPAKPININDIGGVGGRSINLINARDKNTEFRNNVLPDILPPGVSHWNPVINVKDVCDTQKFVIEKIPGKTFIKDFVYYDWETNTIKNNEDKIFDLKNLNDEDLLPGMVKTSNKTDTLYFYNPFRVERYGRGMDYVPEKKHTKDLSVDPTTPSADSGEDYELDNINEIRNLLEANHNYLELDKGDGTKNKITILPLFAKNVTPRNNKKLIQSNIYYLVNPFNKQLILSFVNKKNIDDNKDEGGFLKKNTKFDDNSVDIKFVGYNPLNEEQNKLLLTSDNLYYLNYDFNILIPLYYNNAELGKYLYFNPGMDGYVWEKDNDHKYGVLESTATALDGVYNMIYGKPPEHRDDYDQDIDLVTGVPPHIDFLKIGDKIKTLSKYKLGPRAVNDMRDDRIRLVYFESINLTMLPIMYYLCHILQTPFGLLDRGTVPDFDNKMENINLTGNYKYYIPFKTHYKYNNDDYNLLGKMCDVYGLDANILESDNTIVKSLLYKQIYRFALNLSESKLTSDGFRFHIYNNLKFDDADLTKIKLKEIIQINIDSGNASGATGANATGATGAPGATTPVATGATGTTTPGATTPGATGATGANGTPRISETANNLIEKIKEIAQNNDFNGKVGNILKVSAKFKLGSGNNEYSELDRIFTKALELLNKNLSIENKLLEIPKSVKSYTSKLPSISFVTSKLNVEVRTDGETTSTPNGKELEDLIIKNRDLISDVGNSINMTPKDAVRELTSFINSISRWSPTQGSNPFRYYKDEYKPKFDNFFINKENVEGFIEELKKTIFHRESDENKKILIGKFFKYLPNFVGSKNLGYYKREFGEPTFEYTKAYSESIKKKKDKDKKNKSKKKSRKTGSKKSKKSTISPGP